MARRLFGWFAPKRGEKVLKMVEDHLELTKRAVSDLYRMVEAAAKGEASESKSFFESLSQMEMKADQIRRDMVTELSQRDVFPSERDDLMELVRAVDWVADWAREAGRILVIIPFERLPEELRKSIENMCQENYSCVRVLAKCIRALSGNPKKALELADQVELLEEDVDDLYAESRRIMAGIEDLGMTRGASILLNEFMDAVEMVADWCENTVDIARAIAIRAF